MKRLIIFIFVSVSFFTSSCNQIVVHREIQYFGDGTHYYLLRYINGRYGVEIKDQIVLKKCKNKIYAEGYYGDFALKTQVGNDWHFYNISGQFLFEIPQALHVTVCSCWTENHPSNAYILITRDSDLGKRKGVYSLDGKPIIDTKYESIDAIKLVLSENQNYVFGYEADSDTYDDYGNLYQRFLYDFYGNILVSNYEHLRVEGDGACPIILVEYKDGSQYYYNYKGQRIINRSNFYDTFVTYSSNGYYYITCQTTDYHDEYGAFDDRLWLSFNGDVIKEANSRYENYRVVNKLKNEVRESKKSILYRLAHTPTLNSFCEGSTPTIHFENASQPSYWPQLNTSAPANINIYGHINNTVNSNNIEDNSRWEKYYTDTYNRYVMLVEQHLSTLYTLTSTGSGNGTSNYAISQTKSSIRNTQNDMRRIRSEAQQKGIFIPPSHFENDGF